MEINKQLFEDVLSGKLKGTFVLRNKQIIKSTTLKRSSDVHFPYAILIEYNNGITDYGTFKSDGYFEYLSLSDFDIIDFIPDTNMKENELIIEIPDGKIVDWEESKKQNKIVLKDKQLTYEEICEKLFKNKEIFYINSSGNIESSSYSIIKNCIYDETNATTEHQLKCILAKNKLATIAVYLNDGWKPGKTYSGHFDAYVLFMTPNEDDGIMCVKITQCTSNSNVLFKSRELAEQAIEILGEETVKLALEPLGI